MSFKDYYKILNISYSSSIDEIKTAFRKLAFNYHPDITNNDLLKMELFKEIKEAYHVLSDVEKRKAYDAKYFFINKKEEILTIEGSLLETEKMLKFLQHKSSWTINYDSIKITVDKVINTMNNNKLSFFNDENKKINILSNLLSILYYLPLQEIIFYESKLIPLISNETTLKIKLNELLVLKKKQAFWQKYKILFAIALAIAICLFIALSNKL